MLTFIQRSPDAAILFGTAGFLLIYVEFNRPGTILAGAFGLLLLLLSAAALMHTQLSPKGLVCLVTASILLLVSLKQPPSLLLTLLAAGAITAGLLLLVDGPGLLRVHLPAAVTAGTLLGGGTSLLTAVARRARINKGLD